MNVGSEIDGPATAPDLEGEASKVGREEDDVLERLECDRSRFVVVVTLAIAAALAASFSLSWSVRLGLCPNEVDAPAEV